MLPIAQWSYIVLSSFLLTVLYHSMSAGNELCMVCVYCVAVSATQNRSGGKNARVLHVAADQSIAIGYSENAVRPAFKATRMSNSYLST